MRSLDDSVAQLHAIIGALDVAIADLPTVDMGDHLVEIKRAIDRLEAVFAMACGGSTGREITPTTGR